MKYYQKIKKSREENPQTYKRIEDGVITSLKLFDEEHVIIRSKKASKKVSFKEGPWIVYGERDPLLQFTKTKPSKIIYANSLGTIISMVEDNYGLALMPTHVLREEHQVIRESPPKKINSSIYALTMAYSKPPASLKRLLKLLT